MRNEQRYSPISTLNHWVTALLVVVMLALGYGVAAAPSEAIEEYILAIHIALGFSFYCLWRGA